MKLQSSKYQVKDDVSVYPDKLQMVIVAHKHSGFSTAMFNYFDVHMSWPSTAGSTATYSKSMDVVTFNLVNDKKIRLTKKLFTQILDIHNSLPFYKVTNAQVIHMINEMGHQPPLTKISDFKKSSLPYISNFLFSIYLRCLTGRSVGLDKGRMEVYAMVVGI